MSFSSSLFFHLYFAIQDTIIQSALFMFFL